MSGDRDDTPSDVPDVLASDLDVVLVGINPGRVSAAAHAHFANPRNDFWRLLHAAGFTPRLLEPAEQCELPKYGVGVTNAARDLQPRWLAFVGKEAYRGVFNERPELGPQARSLGATRLFVLPSTSPANASVPWDERLCWFEALAAAVANRDD